MTGFLKIARTTIFYLMLSQLCQAQNDTMHRQIYESLEQMPEFPGGIIAMEQFVVTHLRLPSIKSPQVINGIYTRFIVHSDGSISDIKIARGSGNVAIDDSVKAVIRRMPLWKPGTLNGKPVNCYYNLPVSGLKYK